MVVNDHYNNLRKPIYRQTRHFSTSIVSFDTIYQRMGIKSSCCFSRDSIIEPGVGASLKAIHRGCKKRLKKLLSQNYEQSTNIETSNTEEDISAKNPVGIMKLSLEVAHSSSILTTAALAPTPVNTESRCLSPTDSYETLDRHSDTGSLEEIPLDESSLEYEEPGQPAVTRLAYSIATPLSEFVVTQPLTYLVGWEVLKCPLFLLVLCILSGCGK